MYYDFNVSNFASILVYLHQWTFTYELCIAIMYVCVYALVEKATIVPIRETLKTDSETEGSYIL